MPDLKRIPAKVVSYFRAGIWRTDLDSLPRYQKLLVRILRIVTLSISGFAKDGCALRASALTFYTLLSLVPAAAMAFGIAKGFGFELLLKRRLLEDLQAHQEVVLKIIAFAQSFLENTRGGLIAGVGVIVLLWTVIKVLSNIEHAFNRIWEVHQNRTLVRKFSDYLSIMFMGPIMITLSSSATVFFTTQVAEIIHEISFLGFLSWPLFNFMKMIPYGFIWVLLTFVYMVMPNKRVQLIPALVAGIAAGTLYQLGQWAYITFQLGAARYNAIYGSFAALPLFLIWLQVSWFVVLFGAEISYAYQHAEDYEHEPDFINISPYYRRVLSLLIAHRVIRNFAEGKTACTPSQLSRSLEMPVRLVRSILDSFVESATFSKVPVKNNGSFVYQPARDPNFFSIKYVIDALEKNGVNDLPISITPELETINKSLGVFDETLKKSKSNRLLKDI
jgi:membrane protein